MSLSSAFPRTSTTSGRTLTTSTVTGRSIASSMTLNPVSTNRTSNASSVPVPLNQFDFNAPPTALAFLDEQLEQGSKRKAEASATKGPKGKITNV